MVTKLILNSKINQERKRRVRLELQAESLLKQLMVYEKFVATITELESPNGHFGRLRAPIVLENIINSYRYKSYRDSFNDNLISIIYV